MWMTTVMALLLSLPQSLHKDKKNLNWVTTLNVRRLVKTEELLV